MVDSSPDAEPRIAVRRVADLQLRGRAVPLWARVYWPPAASRGASRAVLVFFPAGGVRSGSIESADALCRVLCSRAGIVVLSASYRPDPPYPAAFEDAAAVTYWAADHAGELDADPAQLLVGGESFGGNLAAAVALRARDQGWPPIMRQLLISPHLDEEPCASALSAGTVDGVAPATVVTVERHPLHDDGRRYAARLRQAGIAVDELRYDDLPHPALTLTSGALPRVYVALADAVDRAVRTGRGPRDD